MNSKLAAFSFLLLITVFACSKADIDTLEETQLNQDLDWEIGKNEYDLEIDDALRNFLIHVPASYTGSSDVPLVFMLHGSTGTGTKFYNISRWVEKSEQENFIAIFPTALAYPLKDGNKISTKWASAGLVEQVDAGTVIKDDIPFIQELVEKCKRSFNIDSSQVYISGFSNGGAFVKTNVIQRLGHVFAAASSAGGFGLPFVIPIEGDRITPLHNIIGTKDHNLLELIKKPVMPIKGEDLERLNGLWSKVNVVATMLELESDYSEEPSVPTHNTLSFKNNQTSGQTNEYEVVIIDELEHNYPNESNNLHGLVAADIVWEWFQKWSL